MAEVVGNTLGVETDSVTWIRPEKTLDELHYLANTYFPVEYVLKNHYNFTEKDYKDYVKMCKRDAKLKWQLAQIEANGFIPTKEDLA